MDHATAARSAKQIRRRESTGNRAGLREYRCPDCGGWHVGHRDTASLRSKRTPRPKRGSGRRPPTPDGYERLGLPPPE